MPITFDQLVSIGSACALAVLGLMTLYFVFYKLRKRVWYWCPRCQQYQDVLGNYGMPKEGDKLGGSNLCSHCERETE